MCKSVLVYNAFPIKSFCCSIGKAVRSLLNNNNDNNNDINNDNNDGKGM